MAFLLCSVPLSLSRFREDDGAVFSKGEEERESRVTAVALCSGFSDTRCPFDERRLGSAVARHMPTQSSLSAAALTVAFTLYPLLGSGPTHPWKLSALFLSFSL
ncbi:hypothetical protein ACFX13_007247 [Malus domestica]